MDTFLNDIDVNRDQLHVEDNDEDVRGRSWLLCVAYVWPHGE